VVEARLRTARIIFAALVLSLVAYAVVVQVLVHVVGWRGTLPEPTAALLRWIFYALGAVMFAGGLVARGRFLRADALVTLARRAGTEAALTQLHARTIALLAVMESVAIYGLVLFLAGGRLADFYVLWGLGLLGQLLLAPRREVWEEVGRAGRGA